MCDVIIHILLTKLKSRVVREMVKVIEQIDGELGLPNFGTQAGSHLASQSLKDVTSSGLVSRLV